MEHFIKNYSYIQKYCNLISFLRNFCIQYQRQVNLLHKAMLVSKIWYYVVCDRYRKLFWNIGCRLNRSVWNYSCRFAQLSYNYYNGKFPTVLKFLYTTDDQEWHFIHATLHENVLVFFLEQAVNWLASIIIIYFEMIHLGLMIENFHLRCTYILVKI